MTLRNVNRVKIHELLVSGLDMDHESLTKFTHLRVYSLCYSNCLNETGQP